MELPLKFRAQMAAMDDQRTLDGKPVPVLTTLMYDYCGNDIAKFNRLCGLIEVIQDHTIRLHEQEM